MLNFFKTLFGLDKLEHIEKETVSLRQDLIKLNESLDTLLAFAQQNESNWRSTIAERTKKEKNDIEAQEDSTVEVDENMRVPIVDGVKIEFEGMKNSKPIPVKIYGQK